MMEDQDGDMPGRMRRIEDEDGRGMRMHMMCMQVMADMAGE
ncbi:MAG: hypothetical protein WD491_15120 [Balneolales bacterium]